MKQKKNETVPVGLLVSLLLFCTVFAGGAALLARGDVFQKIKDNISQMSDVNDEKKSDSETSENTSSRGDTVLGNNKAEAESEAAPVEEEPMYVDEELNKLADVYGEVFGLLVGEKKSSLVEDKYSPNELYQVEYEKGKVQIDPSTKELYWFERYDVKTETIQFTERELVSKAREYFKILQLDKEYGYVARKVDRNKNIATVIFRKVIEINEDLELYSDYEAVKMVLSAQTGELMSCKIFDLPLVEQEGSFIGEKQLLLKLQDQLALTFDKKTEPELKVCSPIIWGDEENYTSRIMWTVTFEGKTYYADVVSGDLKGMVSK